jgi:hypothetical protein
MMQRPPLRPEEYSLKETSPHLGGAAAGDKLTTTYDLVEQMQYLYVRVVKAKELPNKDITGSCDPYVEVKLGNYKGQTRHFEKEEQSRVESGLCLLKGAHSVISCGDCGQGQGSCQG